MAEFLDRPESTLRVVVPDVGGGFGIKAALYPEEFVCAAIRSRFAANEAERSHRR